MSGIRARFAAGITILVLALGVASVQANNLTVTNVSVIGRDDTTACIKFDIQWENSWRYEDDGDPLHFHDAAWVFFKVRPNTDTDWQHVTLEGTGTNPPGYDIGSSGTPIEMIVPTDRVGMFVRRSGDGAGTTSVKDVKAVWNFTSNSLVKTDKVRIQAFGVEMVYVAEGAFWAGNTNGIIASSFHAQGNDNSPILISSTNAFTIYWDTGDVKNTNVPSLFPNGFAAFYCMKYEITQGQYTDFLNTLTRNQQATRCTTNLNYYMSGSATISYRNTVQLTTDPGGTSSRIYTTTRRDRACNYLSAPDVYALADWSGLRPMTELEFEKACRGPLQPVADEYVWGSTTIMAGTRQISGTEDGTETITNYTSLGGCNYGGKTYTGGDGGQGPLRAGIFATNGAPRVEAGASYWGILELGGSLPERTATVGHANGLKFTGLHGDGVLAYSGDASEAALKWPDAYAICFRGGTFLSWSARTSDRGQAALVAPGRLFYYGGRAVRSAPSEVGP